MTIKKAGVSLKDMEMKHFSLSKIIIGVLLLIVSIALIVLIVIWTKSISEENRLQMLKTELDKVTKEKGEKALLSTLGIDVENIFYGEDGLILFEEEGQSWKYSADEMQNISVYKKCAPSVVSIISGTGLSDSTTGSGVIISSDGYVITNRHVLGSLSSFQVSLYDKSTVEATLVGQDVITDIAVIKLEGGKKYIPLEFNLDSNLVVGQKVIAIGSPYGYEWTQSVGTLSGLGRVVTSSEGIPLANMIQSDVAINPGNSGGPLLDSHGRMIGLNTAIYSTSGSSQGISFSIPIDTVMSVATSLIRNGSVNRGWLDILSVELNPLIAEYSSLPISEGILVSQVVPRGEADKSGLKGGSEKVQYGSSVIYLGGDVITAIGDKEIKGYNDYFTALMDTHSGDKLDITVLRNGSYVTLKNVTLVAQSGENTGWIIR